VKIGAELFDSRGYFEPRNSAVSTTEVNAVELGQAYLNVDLSGALQDGSKSSLTAGQFTKDIGSRRLVARNLFRNTVNSFTGLSYDRKGTNKGQMTLLWTMPQTQLPDDKRGIRNNTIEFDRESPDLQLFGGSYTFASVFSGSLDWRSMATACMSRIPGLVWDRCRPGTVACSPPASGWRGRRSQASWTTISRRSIRGLVRETTARHRHSRPQRLGVLLPRGSGLLLRYVVAATDRAAIRSRQRRQQQP
jgi:hypothetical protein